MEKCSKEAKTMLFFVYKIYQQRRKNGLPKRRAVDFSSGFYKSDAELSTWHYADIISSLSELSKIGYIKGYTRDSFLLLDKAIVDMEHYFSDGVLKLSDFLAKFF